MKKNVLIVILICIICALGGYIVGTQINSTNSVNKETNNTKDPDKKEIDPTTLLEKTVGDWGRCTAEYECNGILIRKENGKYLLSEYWMWSEGGNSAPMEVVKIIDENKFEVKMHFDEYEDATMYSPASDLNLTIDLSKIDEDILMVGDNAYKKVVGDPDTFYRKLF